MTDEKTKGGGSQGEPEDYDVPYGSVEGERRCPVCGATFENEDDLRHHQDEAHGEERRSA